MQWIFYYKIIAFIIGTIKNQAATVIQYLCTDSQNHTLEECHQTRINWKAVRYSGEVKHIKNLAKKLNSLWKEGRPNWRLIIIIMNRREVQMIKQSSYYYPVIKLTYKPFHFDTDYIQQIYSFINYFMSFVVCHYHPSHSVNHLFTLPQKLLLLYKNTAQLISATQFTLLNNQTLTINVEAACLSNQKGHFILCLVDANLMFQIIEVLDSKLVVKFIGNPEQNLITDRPCEPVHVCRSTKRPLLLLCGSGHLKAIPYSSIPGMIRVGQIRVLANQDIDEVSCLNMQESEFGSIKQVTGGSVLRGFSLAGMHINPKFRHQFSERYHNFKQGGGGELYCISNQEIAIYNKDLTKRAIYLAIQCSFNTLSILTKQIVISTDTTIEFLSQDFKLLNTMHISCQGVAQISTHLYCSYGKGFDFAIFQLGQKSKILLKRDGSQPIWQVVDCEKQLMTVTQRQGGLVHGKRISESMQQLPLRSAIHFEESIMNLVAGFQSSGSYFFGINLFYPHSFALAQLSNYNIQVMWKKQQPTNVLCIANNLIVCTNKLFVLDSLTILDQFPVQWQLATANKEMVIGCTSKDGMQIFDVKMKKKSEIELKRAVVTAIQIHDQQLWIASKAGLQSYNLTNRMIERTIILLSSSMVNSIVINHECLITGHFNGTVTFLDKDLLQSSISVGQGPVSIKNTNKIVANTLTGSAFVSLEEGMTHIGGTDIIDCLPLSQALIVAKGHALQCCGICQIPQTKTCAIDVQMQGWFLGGYEQEKMYFFGDGKWICKSTKSKERLMGGVIPLNQVCCCEVRNGSFILAGKRVEPKRTENILYIRWNEKQHFVSIEEIPILVAWLSNDGIIVVTTKFIQMFGIILIEGSIDFKLKFKMKLCMTCYAAAINFTSTMLAIYSPFKWLEIIEIDKRGSAKTIAKQRRGTGLAQMAFIGNSLILAHQSGCLSFFKLQPGSKRIITLQQQYGLGQQITCFSRVKSSIYGNRVVFGTKEGSLGMICQLPVGLDRELKSVEQCILERMGQVKMHGMQRFWMKSWPRGNTVDGQILKDVFRLNEDEMKELWKHWTQLEIPSTDPWIVMLGLIKMH